MIAGDLRAQQSKPIIRSTDCDGREDEYILKFTIRYFAHFNDFDPGSFKI